MTGSYTTVPTRVSRRCDIEICRDEEEAFYAVRRRNRRTRRLKQEAKEAKRQKVTLAPMPWDKKPEA